MGKGKSRIPKEQAVLKKIGLVLRAKREELGGKREIWGEKMGVSHMSIYRWESGRDCYLTALLYYCDQLNLKPSDVLREVGE